MKSGSESKTKRVPTHKGTYPCAKWPSTRLYDYNRFRSETVLRNVVSLGDLPHSNATAVILGFADDRHSRDSATLLAKMANDIRTKQGLNINTVFLNNWMPFKCLTASSCPSSGGADCIGGCSHDDPALKEDSWQGSFKPSADTAQMSMLQDTKELQAWRQFGGEKNDILVYDRDGFIFAYACSQASCSNPPSFSNDMTSLAGFQNINSLLVLAANSAPLARCLTKKHDPLLKHFAPSTEIEANEWLDLIVVSIVLVIGCIIGVFLLPRLWACLKKLCGSTVESNRDKFIALSTIDDLDDDDEFL